ncbi:MAG TPA: hypothetical protein VFO18_18230, partial [Methylomirabilota bacterium]|nr:hypothetical protein [Methylomirabilota bacterium]
MIGPRPVALLFTILVLVMVALVVAGVALGLPRAGKSRAARSAALTAAGLIAWLAATSVAARGGFFLDFQSLPPRMLAAILPPLAAVLLFSLTRLAEPVLVGIPPAMLVYLQSFRIVVEFVLWRLVAEGVAPEIMSFHGRNFDILVGLSAPV